MSGIVERLRLRATSRWIGLGDRALDVEAATEIERLREHVEHRDKEIVRLERIILENATEIERLRGSNAE